MDGSIGKILDDSKAEKGDGEKRDGDGGEGRGGGSGRMKQGLGRGGAENKGGTTSTSSTT